MAQLSVAILGTYVLITVLIIAIWWLCNEAIAPSAPLLALILTLQPLSGSEIWPFRTKSKIWQFLGCLYNRFRRKTKPWPLFLVYTIWHLGFHYPMARIYRVLVFHTSNFPTLVALAGESHNWARIFAITFALHFRIKFLLLRKYLLSIYCRYTQRQRLCARDSVATQVLFRDADQSAIHVGLHLSAFCGCYARAFAKQTLHVQPL